MRYMTVEEVAARLRRDPFLVRRWLRDGVLKGQKMGPTWVVEDRDLERFLAGGEEPDRRLTWFSWATGQMWHATREISEDDVAVTLCGRRLDLTGTARTGRAPRAGAPVCKRCTAEAEK